MTTWGISRAVVEPTLVLFGITLLFVSVLACVFILIGVYIRVSGRQGNVFGSERVRKEGLSVTSHIQFTTQRL